MISLSIYLISKIESGRGCSLKMSIEYFKNKYIQVLQDKIDLQEKINALNSEVIDLKAQLLDSGEKNRTSKAIKKSGRLSKEIDSAHNSSGSVVRIRRKRGRLSAELDVQSVSSAYDSSGSECKGDSRDIAPRLPQYLPDPRGYIVNDNSYLDRRISGPR